MTVLDENIIAHYNFDETSGTVLDSTGRFNSTNNGATTQATGHIETAYDFDGSTDNVEIGLNTILSGVSDFTISAWINPDSITGTQLIFGDDTSSPVSARIEIGINGNKLYARLHGETGVTASSGDVSTGSYQHIAFVREGSTIKFYLNGSLVDSDSITATPMIAGTVTFIGARDGIGTLAYDGKIDELGIWDVALTTNFISKLYNEGSGLTYPFNVPSASVKVGTGGIGTRIMDTNYPYTTGLTAGTTKQTGRVTNLVPQKSLVPDRQKVGL